MRWMMLIPLCLLAISCASDPQAAQQQSTSGTNTMSKPDPWLGAKPMQPAPKPQQEASRPQPRKPINASAAGRNDVPPKDAQYTLYCADYVGPSHVEAANRAKQELAELSGMRGWYIIHQEDRSSLFYGYYRDVEEAAIKRDRAAIEGLEDRRGNKAVRAAMPVSVDAPDPIAPPEWNLLNARNGELDTKHYWTLQIAAYQGSPERKQYAVEAVKAARQQGVQAYYYHGPSVSSVCIGVWPFEALSRPDDESVKPDGRNPNGQLMITSGDLVASDQPTDNRLILRSTDGQPAHAAEAGRQSEPARHEDGIASDPGAGSHTSPGDGAVSTALHQRLARRRERARKDRP
jgi:hypothetical protein